MATQGQSSPAVLGPSAARGFSIPGLLARRPMAWRTEATARRALGAMVVAALGLVVVAAAAPSIVIRKPEDGFPIWMVGPFRAVGSLLPEHGLFVGTAFSLLLAVMLVAYLVVLGCAQEVPARWGIGAVVALHLVFLLAPPLALTDVFNYISFARLGILHGVNPYVAPPAEVVTDPSFEFASWRHGLSPYGPLFTVASYPLAALPVPVAHWVLKLATFAASLGCLGLVWRIAGRLGRPQLAAVLLVGLNPLVTVYGLGGVHNDFFMVALILAGVAAHLEGRAARAGAALTAAAGIKLSGGLLLPFALAAARKRREMLAGAVAAGAALVALSLAAFGSHPPAVGIQSRFVWPTSAPNLLGLLVGQGGVTPAIQFVLTLALAATLGALLVRTARGANWLETSAWATIALVLSLSWEMPWYVLWVLPLAALSSSRSLRRATLGLTLFLLVAVAPITGYLLTDVCHCSPSTTETGERNNAYILDFLR